MTRKLYPTKLIAKVTGVSLRSITQPIVKAIELGDYSLGEYQGKALYGYADDSLMPQESSVGSPTKLEKAKTKLDLLKTKRQIQDIKNEITLTKLGMTSEQYNQAIENLIKAQEDVLDEYLEQKRLKIQIWFSIQIINNRELDIPNEIEINKRIEAGIAQGIAELKEHYESEHKTNLEYCQREKERIRAKESDLEKRKSYILNTMAGILDKCKNDWSFNSKGGKAIIEQLTGCLNNFKEAVFQ